MSGFNCPCSLCRPPTHVPPQFFSPGGPGPFGLTRTARGSLPVEQETVPILAVRSARLRTENRGATPFGSINMNFGWFGVESRARCGRGRPHPAPEETCLCGFYSVPADRGRMYTAPSYVQLDVELAGKIVVHQLGYRAGWQRVLGIRVDPCSGCGGPRTRGSMISSGSESHDLWLLCDDPRCAVSVQLERFGIVRVDPGSAVLRPVADLLDPLGVPWTVEES